MLLSSGSLYIVDEQVNLTGSVLAAFRFFFQGVFYAMAILGTSRLGRIVGERLHFNTGIAALMEYVNALTKDEKATAEDKRVLTLLWCESGRGWRPDDIRGGNRTANVRPNHKPIF